MRNALEGFDVGESFPCVVRPVRHNGIECIGEHCWDQLLGAVGAILFRGFGCIDVDQFRTVAKAVLGNLADYAYQSTPRRSLGDGVFTSSEYSKHASILLHNEGSHHLKWPQKLLFGCLKAAAHGGDTTIAKTRTVTSRLRTELVREFAGKGVMYVRNFYAGGGGSWQEVFQTRDRSVVERVCWANGVTYQWLGSDILRTTSTSVGVTAVPRSTEQVWFNQAHIFHVSSLTPGIQSVLLSTYAEDELPRHAFYGDGTRMSAAALDEVRAAYDTGTVFVNWVQGDLLLLDNVQVAHGRTPYTGDRIVVVAMA